MHYERILAAVAGTPWTIEPTKGRAIAAFLSRKARGESIPEHEILAAVSQKRTGKQKRTGAAGVLPVFGMLTPRADMFSEVSGMCSTQQVGTWIDDFAADPSVETIILDIDSPGGAVSGTPELAGRVAAAAKRKKVIAVVDHLAASGAYWVASQASEIVVSPSGQVGSIGAFVMHVDQSEADKKAGLAVTFVSAGERKTAGHPHAPLDQIGREELQRSIDDAYLQFVRAVASGRRVTQTKVREDFGRGGMLRADAAVRVGMADRVATIDEVLRPYGLRMSDSGPEYTSATAGTLAPRPSASGDPGIEIRRRRLLLDRDRMAHAATGTATASAPTACPYPHLVAFHESGHLLVRNLLGDRTATASIVPVGETWGRCTPGRTLSAFNEAVSTFAGNIAQEHCPSHQKPDPTPFTGRGDEARLADSDLPLGLYPDARAKARDLVGRNVLALRDLAAHLVAHSSIDAKQTSQILSRHTLRF